MLQDGWYYLKAIARSPLPGCVLKIDVSFIKPYFVCSDIIYNKRKRESFKNKIDNTWCKVYISVTGGVYGTVENGRRPRIP